MSMETIHEHLLAQVRKYADMYHKRKEYQPGDYMPYAGRVYDSEKLCALVDTSLDFCLTLWDTQVNLRRTLRNIYRFYEADESYASVSPCYTKFSSTESPFQQKRF